MNLDSRHSDPGRSEEAPHLSPTPYLALPRRIAGLAAGVLAASSCLAIFFAPRFAPTAHAFSKRSRAAGAAVFHDKGCEHCHGVDGIGTDRGPELSTIGKRWKKDRIAHQIVNGGGGMPPFGTALQPDEVKQLVDFLSAKRKAPKAASPPAPAKTPLDDSGG